MGNNITQQDIANAMQVSRNTVSKALNNEPGLGEKTRAAIIHKAIEMGYKKIPNMLINNDNDSGQAYNDESGFIALFSHLDSIDNSFFAPLVKGIGESVSRAGYNLVIHMISDEDEDHNLLPKNFTPHNTKGIIMIGSFIKSYYLTVKDTGVPVVLVDTIAHDDETGLLADTIMANNEPSVSSLTNKLIDSGHQEIGFVGDIGSCRSFQERWLGFSRAMKDKGYSVNEDLCIINKSERHCYEYAELEAAWLDMPKKPTAFVCVNDLHAIRMVQILKEQGLNVPSDIAITGFDNISESSLITPALTTIHCYKEEMGKRAGEEIVWRIRNQNRPFELIRITTEMIIRDSI